MALHPLAGKIALVTGASRGIGKGIALQLGQAGATVYITGRTLKSKDGSMGSLEDTAEEISARGGKCIPVQVDHEKDIEIKNLFARIESEQNGRLDILVNNAYKAVNTIFENTAMKFYEYKPEVWDDVNNVGLRNHYFCSVYAARLMVPKKQGLIVNISSYGGVSYLFNVPYGIGKAAVDRMAADCGVELKKSNIAFISLYPGAVRTELIVDFRNKIDDEEKKNPTKVSKSKAMMAKMFQEGESVEFSGKVIVQMAQDPQIMKHTSKCVLSAEYAKKYNIKDVDNREIYSFRQLKSIAHYGLPDSLQFLVNFIPGFLKVPQFVLDIMNSKF